MQAPRRRDSQYEEIRGEVQLQAGLSIERILSRCGSACEVLIVLMIAQDSTLGMKSGREADSLYGLSDRLRVRRRASGLRSLRDDEVLLFGCFDPRLNAVVNVACCVTRKHFWSRDKMFRSFAKLNGILARNEERGRAEELRGRQERGQAPIKEVYIMSDELYCPRDKWLSARDLYSVTKNIFRLQNAKITVC